MATIHVRHHAYCGMSGSRETFTHRDDARLYVALRLRRLRRAGFPVTTREAGHRWEVLEPEDCWMVPDQCGELVLTHELFECRECGTQHTDRDERDACCAVDDRDEE